MATMDFEEFSRGFRERTAQRMLDFERTLAQAQRDIERAATHARAQATQPNPAPRRGHNPGPVRSVLRRQP